MVKRKCPTCGTDNFSAVTTGTWECYKCGAEIERPDEEVPAE